MERETKEDGPKDRKIDKDIRDARAGSRAGRQSLQEGGRSILLWLQLIQNSSPLLRASRRFCYACDADIKGEQKEDTCVHIHTHTHTHTHMHAHARTRTHNIDSNSANHGWNRQNERESNSHTHYGMREVREKEAGRGRERRGVKH